MSTSKLEQLLKKQEQLKAQIQNEKNKERNRERKEDTRRKIIAGGVMLALANENQRIEQWLFDALNKKVKRQADRDLFNLPPQGGGEGQVVREPYND